MEDRRNRRKIAAKKEDQSSMLFIPEEIVLLILMRLSMESLFKSMCVSKRWKSIISDPEFARNYMQRAIASPKSSSSHLWGMLYPFINCRYSSCLRMNCTTNQSGLFYITQYLSRYNLSQRRYRILASSNGLVLSLFSRENSKLGVCISNPLTKQYVELPPITRPKGSYSFGFATQASQTKGSYIAYKVVFLQDNGFDYAAETDKCTAKIFSSDTGNWSVIPGLTNCPKAAFLDNDEGACTFCYKGILHWFNNMTTRTIVTLDLFDNNYRFGHIDLPDGGSGKILAHLGHEDNLKYCEIDIDQNSLSVWLLVDYNKGEWCLEKKCLINPSICRTYWFTLWKRVVAPDPSNCEVFSCILAQDNIITSVDLGSAHLVRVNMSKNIICGAPEIFPAIPLVPFVFCPWSSPFYGQD